MAQSQGPSGTASEYAVSEMPMSEFGEASPSVAAAAAFPPYPPYNKEPAPPSVANTIIAGRDIRVQHKSIPKQAVRPLPKPARPRGPKATDVKLAKRAMRAHARCLRRHGAILTDRLEKMAKPRRRNIISLWREHAYNLSPETVYRLRSMLDADEPFKPDQAYEYFVNLRKTKKKTATTQGVNQIKKDIFAICADKRFVWARNATVAFARGIQQRLSRPGRYALADRMLRLSNIILRDMSEPMNMKTPCRRCNNPKAKFMMEMSDKIAIWIDEVLEESEDRMLMMDFDEDDDVIGADEVGDAGFADDFLNMMGGGGLFKGPQPAYLKFSGPMLEAFIILTDSMTSKGDAQLLSHGKCQQSYKEGADELKQTPSFNATEYDTSLASQLNRDLAETAKPNTPPNIAPYMKDMVDICSNYLAQYAEYNKEKGPGFKLLIKSMKAKGNEQLYQKEKAKRTFAKAATELEEAKGLETDHDDPNLSQAIHSSLSKCVEPVTPDDLKKDMAETLDVCSKYLSQRAIDEIERGPAFDLLINELEKDGSGAFTPNFAPLNNKFAAAYTLKSAPGLSSCTPNPETVPMFRAALHKAVDTVTPNNLKADMEAVIGRCSNYLSAFARDRGRALELLLKVMKANGKKELVKRNNYAMDYAVGAMETETAPTLVPFQPVKDIADETKLKLTQDVESSTPADLKLAMKSLVQDVAKHLSQAVALRSGVAGERYGLNLLAAVKKSLGDKALYKYKSFGQTYSDAADELKYAGPSEADPKCEELQFQISAEMARGVPTKLTPTITDNLTPAMSDASKHLAKVGMEKGEALDYVVKIMKEEGEAPLGQLQGYSQSFADGARRIENSKSLANDKVDRGAYESVRGKLTALSEKKPDAQHSKHLPGVIEDASKFLAAPFPESDQEKRQVLADLMARKGDTILSQEGLYKLTFKEGGEEIMNAPLGVTKAHDEKKRGDMLGKVNTVMPDKKIQDLLSVPANEGAAHLTDLMKGRGDALQVIHGDLKHENEKDFLKLGKFDKDHDKAAAMIETAPYFGGQRPHPMVLERTDERIQALPGVSGIDKTGYMKDTAGITSNYLAGVATAESGLTSKQLAAMDPKAIKDAGGRGAGSAGGVGGAGGAGGAGGKGVGGAEMAGTEEERRKAEEARRRAAGSERAGGRRGGRSGSGLELDPERASAMAVLHSALRAKGGEAFYKQPHTSLGHSQASDWLQKPPMKVDKTVKESADAGRLHKKFERRLSALVSKNTPSHMVDTMQDVVIESSRMLSEYFVSSNYQALVREALISEMQKRGNEILVEVDGAAETFFFAAQRLKKAKSLDVKEPCAKVAYNITKKLDDMIRCRSMARKLTSTMKDHIKVAADYLSELVTKPDERIEAYVSLLGEMEVAGDALLLEGDIPISYTDAAAYLRQLTSPDDQINMTNTTLKGQADGNLKKIMANVAPTGYSSSVLDGVISESTKLLVSYIMLQGVKTEALKIMIQQMDAAGDNVLLRHGTIRKSYSDAADMLRDKNTNQLRVSNVDPVVARKIQIKLHNLMADNTPDKYKALMDDFIQVCKCMKNVFVQCELWCDEILRRVARPCCTCSRHVSTQALQDLAPAQRIQISPSASKAYAPGIEISMTPCPAKMARTCIRRGETPPTFPASKRTSGCENEATTSHVLYSMVTHHNPPFSCNSSSINSSLKASLDINDPCFLDQFTDSEKLSPFQSMIFDRYQKHDASCAHRHLEVHDEPEHETQQISDESAEFYHTPLTTSRTPEPSRDSDNAFWQAPTTMYARVLSHQQHPSSNSILETTKRSAQVKSCYSSRTPIVTTDEMADWHAMMVSLMWNVQAWRDWIQEHINRATSYKYDPNVSPVESEKNWATLERRIASEALQWRQYNKFSRQLMMRLVTRYKDKQIASPTRATVKTTLYRDCQLEMLDIVNMFYKWTHWLSTVVKETTSLQQATGSDIPLHELRWNHFKKKIDEYCDDWTKYNMHLKTGWEHKYQAMISEWLPSWNQPGPVWVVSACGAVPSGAVAAGVYDGEVTWVARTTHKCNVLPASLHPSKHCCLVYADSSVHHYTKYQVMCNAEVKWVAWRAGKLGACAVKVAPGVYVGRVHYRGSHLLGPVSAPSYRCHIVIFGRPFAFNCYELLVLEGDRR